MHAFDDVADIVLEYVPAPHETQLLTPIIDENDPDLHCKHTEVPVVFAYDPILH